MKMIPFSENIRVVLIFCVEKSYSFLMSSQKLFLNFYSVRKIHCLSKKHSMKNEKLYFLSKHTNNKAMNDTKSVLFKQRSFNNECYLPNLI